MKLHESRACFDQASGRDECCHKMSEGTGQSGEDATEKLESDALTTWKLYLGGNPPEFIPVKPGAAQEMPRTVLRQEGISAWGSLVTLHGYLLKTGSIESALLWAETPAGGSFDVSQLLPKIPSLKQASTPLLLKMLALRSATVTLGGDDLQALPEGKHPAEVEALIDAEVLPPLMSDWPGLHFRGDLALNIPAELTSLSNGAAGEVLPPAARQFLQRIFHASVPLRGSILAGDDDDFLVELEWKPEAGGGFGLRAGTDWAIEFLRLAVAGSYGAKESGLDVLEADARLTLGGHALSVFCVINLAAGTVSLDVEPNLVIDFAWLRSFAGEKEYQQGAAGFFNDQAPATASGLLIERITGVVAWKPKFAIDELSLTIANPKDPKGNRLPWKVLGGMLEAEVTARWQRGVAAKNDGDEVPASVSAGSSFDCEFAGVWTWDKVRFQASLDTRSGDFFAQLDFDEATELAAFARRKLFPGTEITAPSAPAMGGGEDAEDDGSDLMKPFRVVCFDVAGNYKEKQIEVQLETDGFIGFMLTPKGAANPVEIRIGRLLCAGLYEQGDSDTANWKLQVQGTVGLLRNGKPVVLGKEGAIVRGTFSRDETRLQLSIASFNLGQLIAMLTGGEPPAALAKGVKNLEIDYRAGDSFSLKCKPCIVLFETVSIEHFEMELQGTQAKASKPAATSASNGTTKPVQGAKQEERKPVNRGSAKIAFGSALSVSLTVELSAAALVFEGTAQDVDVSEVIASFQKKQGAAANTEEPNRNKGGGFIAKKIQVKLEIARDTPQPGRLDVRNSITILLTVERGKSTVTMMLRAMGIADTKGEINWRVVFAGDLELQAKDLPLVGDIAGDMANGFGLSLHALYLSTGASGTADAKVLEASKTNLNSVWLDAGKPRTLKEGFNLRADLIRPEKNPSGAPKSRPTLQGNSAPAEEAPAAEAQAVTKREVKDNNDITWRDQDLRLGPLQVSRIGYGEVKKPATENAGPVGTVKVDAALDLKVVRLAVVGLGVEVDLTNFKVTPTLEGLAISVRNGPIEITGALVYRDGVYMGTAQVRTPAMTLGAIGRFTMQNGRASFFLYCVCEKSLGGPPEFFVEGLAGGMGYDTRLLTPAVEDVPKFALVEAAEKGLGEPEKAMATFDRCIVLSPHDMWFAAGVRFSTYKMLKSVVVVAVSIGEDVEVDLFGISTLRIPMEIPGSTLKPIAKITLAIRGRFSVKEGTVWIQGRIMPGSYVFAESCQISGGFAFQAWFSGPYKGDFAMTVGGYHPRFARPQHYFDVPRVALEWQLDDDISVKGSAYMALTSRAIMAGGRLEMQYHGSWARASFIAEAHFLASWAPLAYSADISIDAAVTFQLPFWPYSERDEEVHAMLHLAGPPFHGSMRLSLPFHLSLSIDFGTREEAKPLQWKAFTQSFLPKPEEVITMRGTGLNKLEAKREVMTVNQETTVTTRWILLPGKPWELTVESVVPATGLLLDGKGPQPKPTSSTLDKFYVPALKKEMSNSRLILEPEGTSWKTLQEELLLDLKGVDALVAPVAPALWTAVQAEPRNAAERKSREEEIEANRLNPAQAKDNALAHFGVVLRSTAPPKLDKQAIEPADTVTKSSRRPKLRVSASSIKAGEKLNVNLFALSGDYTRGNAGGAR